jgi:hypothetical protein
MYECRVRLLTRQALICVTWGPYANGNPSPEFNRVAPRHRLKHGLNSEFFEGISPKAACELPDSVGIFERVQFAEVAAINLGRESVGFVSRESKNPASD